MAMVAEWKKKEVEELASLIAKGKVVGIVGIQGVPAAQMRRIRERLKEVGRLRVSRNRLIARALEKAKSSKPGVEALARHLNGPSGIVVSDLPAYDLFWTIERLKERAPAKGGEVAPEDIVVEPGELPLKPGPVVAELQAAGIPVVIDRGKVKVKERKVLVRKGERIPREIALALAKMDILPLEVGLDARAFWEEGLILTREHLSITPEDVAAMIAGAREESLRLAVGIGYAVPETIPILLPLARARALALATALGYVTPETVVHLLAQAAAQAAALSNALAPKEEEAPPEEEKEEEKEEEEEAASGLAALFG
ncbi:MAG: 50S ribosomal protein L10 [Thermoplasmata archaeon]|nr:MAG: 50S ribosomal protein L10 [Thermoplasmata archaeon]HDJ27286.1 50S ribosomal protein L10 [Aciduliprofundum sp.]